MVAQCQHKVGITQLWEEKDAEYITERSGGVGRNCRLITGIRRFGCGQKMDRVRIPAISIVKSRADERNGLVYQRC